MTNIAPEEFPRRDPEGYKLPTWVKVGAVVRFYATGREVVECLVDQVSCRGIALSNGERFSIAHLRRGRTDATSYFEKHDARARVWKTVRP